MCGEREHLLADIHAACPAAGAHGIGYLARE